MYIKIIKLLHKLKLLNYFNFNASLKLNNISFKIPIINGIGYSNLFMSEMWFIPTFDILQSIKNNIFIDVGTNIGQTLIKVKSVKNQLHYIGFEPNPSCVYYIEKLIEANSFKQVEVFPVGISTKNEIATLNTYSTSNIDSSASIIENFRPDEKIIKKIHVPLFDINQLNINFDNISIIKIDVEGAELEVVKSFVNILTKSKPFILIEILPVYSQNNTFRINRQNELLNILKSLNYILYRIIKNNDQLLAFKKIDDIEIHDDLNKSEYLFVHKEFENEFENMTKQKKYDIKTK